LHRDFSGSFGSLRGVSFHRPTGRDREIGGFAAAGEVEEVATKSFIDRLVFREQEKLPIALTTNRNQIHKRTSAFQTYPKHPKRLIASPKTRARNQPEPN
jgi:hypothetical protein